MKLQEIRRELSEFASPEKAAGMQRFFKTGPGQYGEGDTFIGVTVPQLRALAKRATGSLTQRSLLALLRSRCHEERLLGLLVLVQRFQRGDREERRRVFDTYCANLPYVNNWDLVDLTAPYIVGPYLYERERDALDAWSRSADLWERRVSMVATFYFIRQNDFGDTLRIADTLLQDDHDLIHKAVGWMLREVGNRDRAVLGRFLKTRYATMPRTMLRYAIERFPEDLRQRYLKGLV